ncbi:MAG: phosphotransferase [Maritimibacter sp.]|nr:phosphotransferase [Maritimibacter sp.]
MMHAKFPLEGYIQAIAARVAEDLQGKIDLTTLRWTREPGKRDVEDQTYSVYIDGHDPRDGVVLLVSNPDFPNAVRDGVVQASAVSGLLSPETAGHVITPCDSGQWGEQTWAAFPKFTPMSDSRLIGYAQKIRFAPRVADWLAEVARETRKEHAAPAKYGELFIAPLRYLCDADDLSPALRAAACGYLDYVAEIQPRLFTVVEHTDLWLGNMFFARGAGQRWPRLMGDFYVVDWRGARTDGYPAADLLRYCQSIFLHGGSRPGMLLRDYGRHLGIDAFEMGLYVLLSIGRLGMNLDQFPRAKYIELSSDLFEFMKLHLFQHFPWALPSGPNGYYRPDVK